MRATLTLDDDIAAVLKDRAKKLGVSFKEIVNRTLRSGLEDVLPSNSPRVEVIPFDMGPCLLGPDVNFNHLADEIDDERIIAKMQRAKMK